MFRCSVCKKTVPPRTPCKRFVTTRMHHHPFRGRVQKRWGVDKNGRKKLEWRDDIGGIGSQIVEEYPVCPGCAIGKGIA